MASSGFIPRFRTLARLGRAVLSLVLAVQIISPSLIVAGPLPAGAPSKYPEWWFKRDVVPRLNSQTISPVWPTGYPGMDDYSAANLGQLKAIATAAYDELQTNLPGGAGTAATNLVKSWFQTDANGNFILDAQGRRQPKASAPTDDFAAANLGQLKAVAKPFYDTLILRDYATAYPWANGTADNFAMANLGQLKSLFSFDVNKDTDHDGLPDWWEKAFFGPGGLNLPLSPAQRAALALGGSWGSNPYNPQTGTANPGGGDINTNPDEDPPLLQAPFLDDVTAFYNDDTFEWDYTKAVLTWYGSSPGTQTYLVERKFGSNDWQAIATVGGSSNTYKDNNLVANQRYRYRVTGQNTEGRSAASNVQTYTAPLTLKWKQWQERNDKDKPGFREYTTTSGTPPKYYLFQSGDYLRTVTRSGDGYSYGYTDHRWFSEYYTPRDHLYSMKSHKRGRKDDNTYGDDNYEATSIGVEEDDFTLDTQDLSPHITTAKIDITYVGVDNNDADDSDGYLNHDDRNYNHDYHTAVTYDPDGVPTYSGNSNYLENRHREYMDNPAVDTTKEGHTILGSSGDWTGTMTDENGSLAWDEPAWITPYGHYPYIDFPWGTQGITATPTTQTHSSSDGDTTTEWNTKLETVYTTDQFMADVAYDLPEFEDFDSGGVLADWKAWRRLSSDEAHFSIGKYKYKFVDYPSAEADVKWYEVFVPDNDRNNIILYKTRTWTAGSSGESDEYTIDPTGDKDLGSGYYDIYFAPRLDAYDRTTTGSDPLDQNEKKHIGAEIVAGDTPGTTHFKIQTIGLANAKYNIVWHSDKFQVYDLSGNPIDHNHFIDGNDFGNMEFYVVANSGALVGDSMVITLKTRVNGQDFGTDTLLVKVVADSSQQKDYTLPVDDASGPKYRKIALNGRPMSDEKPQQTAESNVEKEETFVDAMTLALRHSVTDIYVPVPGSELSLSARRNVESTVWNTRSGLRPHERPDRPFGVGWTSSLAPTAEYIYAPGQPVYVYVTDENGTGHRFVECIGENGFEYIPMPTARAENSDYLSSFDGSIFKSRYGTTISFTSAGSVTLATASDRWAGSAQTETHSYLRATRVADRLGNALVFHYAGTGLVPDTIGLEGHVNQKIYLRYNEDGLVTDLWDPLKLHTHFDYQKRTYQDHGKDYFIWVLTQVQTEDGATQYDYEFLPEQDQTPLKPEEQPTPKLHLDLKSITDPNGHTYTFNYEFDQTKFNYSTVSGNYYAQTGLPRNVRKVILPDNEFATFVNQSHLELTYEGDMPKLAANSLRRTLVTDAEKNQITYSWSEGKVFMTNDLATFYNDPISIPKVVYYTQMEIAYAGVGSETYTFDVDAGLAVSSIVDLSGNKTSFTYGDAWEAPAEYRTLFSPASVDGSFNGKYGDPTIQENALLQKKYFTYADKDHWRVMKQVKDEAGRTTTNTIDDLGRRTSETIQEANGQVVQQTEYRYDDNFPGVVKERWIVNHPGQAGTVLPAAGDLRTQYHLDGDGRVDRETVDPTGLHLETVFSYDDNGNKLTVTDPLGRVTYFGYDARNRLVGVANPDGTLRSIGYDPRGNKISETDEKTHATHFHYDNMNRLIEQRRFMVGGDDLVTKFTYNRVGSRESVEDPNHHLTQTEYDALQRPKWTIDAAGKTTLYSYGANSGGNAFDSSGFKPTRIEDPRGIVTLLTHDKLYRTTDRSVEYAPGQTALAQTTYDDAGNAWIETDGLGKKTTRTYDALNRVKTITFDDGAGQTFYYTTTGLKWKVEDELHRVTTTEYDLAGRPVKVTAPSLGAGQPVVETTTGYDAAGNVLWVKDPLQRQTDFTYDKRNRKVREEGPAVIDALTGVLTRPMTDWEYDEVGNVKKVTDPRNYVTTTDYDNANRKTLVTSPAVPVVGQASYVSPQTSMTYDGNGNVLTVTDPNGHVTVNTYDALNRLLTSKVWPAVGGPGITVTNEYDEVGNRTAVIDGKNHRTEFTYDGLNRNLTIKAPLGNIPLGKITEFFYDAVNKTARKDANAQGTLGLTQSTSYGYDRRHRLTTVEYFGSGANTRTYHYDDAGRLETVTETNQPAKTGVAYTYDALDRVLTETSGGVMHTYTYDAVGNRLSTVYGDTTRSLVSTYDDLNRLDTVTESGRTTHYHYDLAGNLVSKVLPNGDTVATIYDGLNRSTKITGVSAAGQTLYQYAPAHDQGGNVRAIAEESVGIADRYLEMTYDGTNRLLTEKDTSSGVPKLTTYTYDDANNRASRTRSGFGGEPSTTYHYDDGNRLTSLTEGARNVLYGYDNNGNRTARTENGVVNATYGYDRENRLTTLSQDGHNYAYTYDYRTRRVERTEGAVVTKVIFSGGTSVQEKENNATTVEYVRGSDWGGGVGGILYTLRAGTPSFTHYDSRGDVTAKTDNTGSVTYQASYEAFGKRTQELGATADRQKANTKEEDPTGLLNEGMRYRDLETGTFITADPAGFVDGPNLYAYVRQNPWTAFDPEGLGAKTEGGRQWEAAHPKIAAYLNFVRGLGSVVKGATDWDPATGNGAGDLPKPESFNPANVIATRDEKGNLKANWQGIGGLVGVVAGSKLIGAVAGEVESTAPVVAGSEVEFRAPGRPSGAPAKPSVASEPPIQTTKPAPQQTPPEPSPNPITAKPGETQVIDPNSVKTGQRDGIEQNRLDVQKSLILNNTPRTEGLPTVTQEGVIFDGHHHLRAASDLGRSVRVKVIDFPEHSSRTGESVKDLPVHDP